MGRGTTAPANFQPPAPARGRDPSPSRRPFGAEEAGADVQDNRTFERNMPDPAAEKRRAYAPGYKKDAEDGKPGTPATTGGGGGPRRVYSARRAPAAAPDEDAIPGVQRVPGNYTAAGAAARREPQQYEYDGYDEPNQQPVAVLSARVVEDDEADIEARVQERLQRQSQEIAEQIRQELANEQASQGGAKQGAGVGSGETEKSDDDDDDTWCGFKKSLVIGVVILALVVVGGAIGIVAGLNSGGSPEPSPTQPPVVPREIPTPAPQVLTPAPSFGGSAPTTSEGGALPSEMCTLCADGTTPEALEDIVLFEDQGTTCADHAENAAAFEAGSSLCGFNQALAWPTCGCPTLPPPVEDPPCTLCEDGADLVGTNAAFCTEIDTWAGHLSTGSSVLPCETYLEVAVIANCVCPEGPIVAGGASAPSPPPAGGSTTGSSTRFPTPPPSSSPVTDVGTTTGSSTAFPTPPPTSSSPPDSSPPVRDVGSTTGSSTRFPTPPPTTTSSPVG